MSDLFHNVRLHLSDPPVILNSIKKVDKGYQTRKDIKCQTNFGQKSP